MDKEYYQVVFIANNKEIHCIWYTNNKDGFVTECKKIKCFTNSKKLKEYAEKNKMNLNIKNTLLSMDEAKLWLQKRKSEFDCEYLLSFWNIISDLAYSVGEIFYGDQDKDILIKIYDKLFYGNNLPSITPEDKKYFPEWEVDEIKEIAKVIEDGLKIVNTYIYI